MSNQAIDSCGQFADDVFFCLARHWDHHVSASQSHSLGNRRLPTIVRFREYSGLSNPNQPNCRREEKKENASRKAKPCWENTQRLCGMVFWWCSCDVSMRATPSFFSFLFVFTGHHLPYTVPAQATIGPRIKEKNRPGSGYHFFPFPFYWYVVVNKPIETEKRLVC